MHTIPYIKKENQCSKDHRYWQMIAEENAKIEQNIPFETSDLSAFVHRIMNNLLHSNCQYIRTQKLVLYKPKF